MPTVFENPAALKDAIGKHLGYSDWLTVEQSRIDQFADATLDGAVVQLLVRLDAVRVLADWRLDHLICPHFGDFEGGFQRAAVVGRHADHRARVVRVPRDPVHIVVVETVVLDG